MIHIVIGTKAQLIKMAPILKTLSIQNIPYNYIFTGQHRSTIDQIHENFGIKRPDQVLYEGRDITSVAQMLVWAVRLSIQSIVKRKRLFKGDRKGIVLVHGDTFSTLIGAIMAKFARLKVGHVESGLRSFNIFHPFPEELTRLFTFQLADIMYCPNKWAIGNVEKYHAEKINTGLNTLSDSLRFALPCINEISLDNIPDKEFSIVTLHRFENIHNRKSLTRIVDIVQRIGKKRLLIFILHKPTHNKLIEFGLYKKLEADDNIILHPRMDYFKFIKLITLSEFVVSDGGSNQEECYFLGKPILLLRKTTERNDGLGENCLLSQYDDNKVDEFVNNVKSYVRQPIQPKHLPSDIIVDSCKQYC